MQEISSDLKIELRTLIQLSTQIARRGYDEPIVELALRRKGISPEIARLIAASVVSCHATILAAEGHARLDERSLAAGRNTDLLAARAASRTLSKIASFLLFIMAGLGGGLLLGWSIGFDRGMNDGFDWIVHYIERLIGG